MVEKWQNMWLLGNSTSVVLQQCQNKVSFQRNGSGVILKYFLNFFEVLAVFSIHKRARYSFEKCDENIIRC